VKSAGVTSGGWPRATVCGPLQYLLGLLNGRECRMRKRLWNVTFERESYWLVLLYVLLPLLAILLSIIIPGLWHRWFS